MKLLGAIFLFFILLSSFFTFLIWLAEWLAERKIKKILEEVEDEEEDRVDNVVVRAADEGCFEHSCQGEKKAKSKGYKEVL